MLKTKSGRILAGVACAVLAAGVVAAGTGTSATAQAAVGTAGAAPTVAPGPWTIDLAHTNINFSVRHMVVSQVRGRFNKYSGSLVVGKPDLSGSSVEFTIDAASVDTNQPQRDAHLRTADFFDVANYPTITFKSTSIAKRGALYVAHGVFTMHGVSKQVDLPFELSGPVKDAFGATRLGLQSHLKLNRQDYGVKWNAPLDNGGLAVSNEVEIEINLEATPAKPAS